MEETIVNAKEFTWNDFLNIYWDIGKYVVFLICVYLFSSWCNTQLENEAEAMDRERERPILTKELINEDDDTKSPKEIELQKQEQMKQVKEALRPLGKKKLKEGEKDSSEATTWDELHRTMLQAYKTKYPEHGPQTSSIEGDEYDDEMKELFRKHLGKTTFTKPSSSYQSHIQEPKKEK